MRILNYETMNLEDLKKRATASELTLIEATEKALRADAVSEVRKKVLFFIQGDFPPSRDDFRMRRDAGDAWLRRLDEHLIPEEP